MKLAEVVIGALYMVRVSGNFVAVRIAAPRANGERGWLGVNQQTGRTVLFRGAARLRYRLCEECWTLGKQVHQTWGNDRMWCQSHAPKPVVVESKMQEVAHD